ncbi:4Fe-4S binding protein [Zongyangia hominis]|uniref:4Fe-4S binding protein n=1 Tax=Zongyangia hominis TaxID=2763677 RepID=A0A926IBQ3_9FIRM|nr:4Fe-4S dicluster domain-containing protein [Zongyangia hominis]MBC8570422.1 4Fe-4S binding protein [Zongyangia hominis]
MQLRKKGVPLEQRKDPAISRPIAHYLFPKKAYLRLPGDAALKHGDQVQIDEPVFTVKNQAVFSPIDAMVEEILRPSFDPDHTYAALRNTVTPTQRQVIQINDPETVEADRILGFAKKCSVLDAMDGEFLYQKLERLQDKRKLVIVGDAIDDEPMVSSRVGPLLKLTAEAAGGLRLVQRALDATEGCFAVFGDSGDAVRFPKTLSGIPVVKLRGHYPARLRLKNEIKKRYPGRQSVIISVPALIHLYRAVVYEKPQSSTFVTVAGDAVANPANVEVALGTPVGEVLRFAGLAKEPKRLIAGGTMAGYRITDTETPVRYGLRCLIADTSDGRRTRYECIGCARCVKACPVGINPYLAYRYIDGKNRRYRWLELDKCIKCGLCSYICPSNIDVASYIQSVLD